MGLDGYKPGVVVGPTLKPYDELSAAEQGLNFLAREADATNKEKGFQAYEEELGFLEALAGEISVGETAVFNEANVDMLLRIQKNYRRTILMEKLMLAVSELGEAAEDLRQKEVDWQHYGEELADTVIRIIGHAHSIGLSIGERVVTKMKKNKTRPYLHGKAA